MAGGVDVVKPLIDKRQYGVLTLDNGLQALLISDIVTDKAAAALDVRRGWPDFCTMIQSLHL